MFYEKQESVILQEQDCVQKHLLISINDAIKHKQVVGTQVYQSEIETCLLVMKLDVLFRSKKV